MKIWQIGLIGVGGWIAWDLWNKFETATTLAVNFVNVDFSNFPNVKIVLSIQNVTNSSLTINSLAGSVTVDGSPFSSVSLTNQLVIEPNQITKVTLNTDVNLFSLPQQILSVIQNLSGSLTFNIIGNVNVQGIPVPVPINITQTFSV